MRNPTLYSRRRSKTGTVLFNNTNRVSRILFRLNSYARISAHMILSGAPAIDIIRSQFPLVTPHPARPVLITVELTNHCNVRCAYCNNPLCLRERGYMADETFTRFIDGIEQLRIPRVRVVGNGDAPLCYNSILQYEPPGLILCSLGDTALTDIWNGDVLTQYRKAHHKRIPELMPLCKGCTAV